MFRTITSPSPGASSHKLYKALVCSCYQASLAVAIHKKCYLSLVYLHLQLLLASELYKKSTFCVFSTVILCTERTQITGQYGGPLFFFLEHAAKKILYHVTYAEGI